MRMLTCNYSLSNSNGVMGMVKKVHSLTHLIDDFKRYGPNGSISAFFNRTHSGNRIIEQVLNRYRQCSTLGVIGLLSKIENSGLPHNRSRTTKLPKSFCYRGTVNIMCIYAKNLPSWHIATLIGSSTAKSNQRPTSSHGHYH